MKKIFLTGGTGFIGSILLERLIERNHEVYILCRNVTDRNLNFRKEINVILGDLTDPHHLRKSIKQINPDVVIHLAAQSSVAYSHEHPQENAEVTYIGTINLQKACEGLSNLEKFVYAGSSEEYGNQIKFPIKEDAPLLPNQPYAIAKVAADNYLNYCKESIGFPSVILRPFNTLGRTKNFTFVTEKIIYNMLVNQSETLTLGNPDAIRDLLYVDDHVNGYVKAVETPFDSLENVRAINLCTGIGTSIKSLAEQIKSLTDFEGEIRWNVSVRPTEIHRLIGDYVQAVHFLGWKPQYPLREGLKLAIENIKKVLG